MEDEKHVCLDKIMKILQTILIGIFSIVLTSCEQFGIEVTTVKGEWKSQAYKNQYLIINISDNGMSHQTIHNDSVIVNRSGTWSLHNDTLSLYHQDFNANGVRQFKIEQMSMNTLTLRNLDNKDIWVMTRQYSTTSNDYDSHFSEVFDLKRGFWWYTWNIILFVLGNLCVYLIGCVLIMVVSKFGAVLIKWIRKNIKKS